MKRLLVIAAHSDDEVLGCGGVISSEAERGAEVNVMFLTNGVGSRGDKQVEQSAVRRAEAARKAGDILGVRSIFQHDFPDNQLDTVPLLQIVQTVEAVLIESKPSIILTHHSGDLNVDHQICSLAVTTATRPQPGHSVHTVLGFEVPSSTEWAFSGEAYSPNYFVDISQHLEKKLNALAAYKDELRGTPHPRSLESVEFLARWRGSIAGYMAAEAFKVIRTTKREVV